MKDSFLPVSEKAVPVHARQVLKQKDRLEHLKAKLNARISESTARFGARASFLLKVGWRGGCVSSADN
jgi:hypothetical protein